MALRIFFVSLISWLTFPQCTSSKIFPSNFDGKQLEYGSGGGFSGNVISYILLENGMVFKKESLTNTLTKISKLENNITSQAFNNYRALGISDIIINQPGNMYKFLNFNNGQEQHKIVWSGKSGENNLDLYYDYLKGLVILEN